MKFVHLADIHIRLLKYHNQYRQIFNELYEKIYDIVPDYIVIAGDLLHNKINISNESIDLASEFLKNLSDIQETYIITGNHDHGRSKDRLDSISPIVSALNHPRLHYLKYTQQIELKNDFILNVLSIVDKENWNKIQIDNNKINIALFHGSVKGSITETGWIVDKGEIDLDLLKKFNFCFIGDIHTKQKLDEEGRIIFPGSLIQQNFSETQEKGFLIWDIKDKNNFNCNFIPLINPSPFISIELEEDGSIPNNVIVPNNSKIRVITNNNLPYEVIKKSLQNVNISFKPESVVYLNKGINEKNISSFSFGSNIQENLRDLEVQERLIKDYLKDYNISESILNKVLELNRKYKIVIDNEEEEIRRNICWKIETLEWDNLLNYDEGNIIDFNSIKGIVGILGSSFSGKTNSIEVLLHTIFDSNSKGERKGINIINQNKDIGIGKVVIELNNKKYYIERKSEKYKKILKGKITDEAKVVVNFYSIDNNGIKEDLNGSERDETNRNIRKIFGTIDDFLLTNMSTQFDFLSFINEGSTKRKEILAKFLDLEVFDKKYKLAKEASINVRGAIKRLENKNFINEIKDIEKQLKYNREELNKQRGLCNSLKEEKEIILNQIDELKKQIDLIPTEIIDIKKVRNDLENKSKQLISIKISIEESKKNIKEKEEINDKIEQFIKNDFDISSYRLKKEEVKDKQISLETIKNNIKHKHNTLDLNKKKTNLLKEVPCSKEFSHCKFIKDAYNSQLIVEELEKEIEKLLIEKEEKQNYINSLELEKIEGYIKKYELLTEKNNNLIKEISSLKTKFHKDEILLMGFNKEIENLQNKIQEYDKNKDIIENLESIVLQKKGKEQELIKKDEKLEECEKEILKLYKKHGMLEQKHEELNKQKNELDTLREEYSAYELFEMCFNSSGISYEIIKRKLPFINEEISKILTNIVPFQIFLETSGNKLEILIKHPKYEARSLSLGSGAEKTISAFAIRCAFIEVGTLPRTNILILDEPATAFDSQLMDEFIKMLEILKEKFDSIILISHLDSLKDVVDMEIIINKRNGYAHIEQ